MERFVNDGNFVFVLWVSVFHLSPALPVLECILWWEQITEDKVSSHSADGKWIRSQNQYSRDALALVFEEER